MSEKRVFQKYLRRYLSVVMIVVLCCIPFGYSVYRYVKEYTLTQSRSQLRENVGILDVQFERMNTIAAVMSGNASLQNLKRVRGQLPSERYLYMNDVRDTLSDVHLIYSFSPFSFLVFRNMPAFISSTQVSEDYYRHYERFLSVGDMDAEGLRGTVLDTGGSAFVPFRTLTYYSSSMPRTIGQGFLYIVPLEGAASLGKASAYQAFVIDGSDVVNMLLPVDAKENSLILLRDKNGDVVFTYGMEPSESGQPGLSADGVQRIQGRQYYVNHFENEQTGIETTVCYAMGSIQEQWANVMRTLLLYIVIGCAAALVLTACLTWKWFKPLGRILYEVNRIESVPPEGENVYDYIRESLFRMVSSNDKIKAEMLLADAQKQSILLEKIFMQGFPGQEEKERFRAGLPHGLRSGGGYYMAAVCVSHEDAEQESKALLYAAECFGQLCGRFYLSVYPESNLVMIFLAENTAAADGVSRVQDDGARESEGREILELFQTVRDRTVKNYGARVTVGISQRQVELDRINVAGAQARQTVSAYRDRDRSVVEFYQTLYAPQKSGLHMDVIRRLYDMILCSDRKALTECFEEMRTEILTHPEQYEFQKQEICGSVQFMLNSVCQQMMLPLKENIDLNLGLQNQSFDWCLQLLLQRALSICGQIDEQKSGKKESAWERLKGYLDDNFSRPELTADLVSRETELSEKAVYMLLKERTGTTFAVYLETLRLEYAKKCLQQTDWSNERVAEEAGFGSTNSFYRIFRKKTGVSPNVYRKGQREEIV